MRASMQSIEALQPEIVMSNIVIVFHSGYGHIKKVAEAVATAKAFGERLKAVVGRFGG